MAKTPDIEVKHKYNSSLEKPYMFKILEAEHRLLIWVEKFLGIGGGQCLERGDFIGDTMPQRSCFKEAISPGELICVVWRL